MLNKITPGKSKNNIVSPTPPTMSTDLKIYLGIDSKSQTANENLNFPICSFLHGLPATIPMTDLLHSTTFATAGMIFAGLAVSASYVANGTGLFGFIKDMTFTYWKIENRIFVGCLAFIIPLVVTLVYPNIFLSAVDIVGGVGETILFLLLPGVILFKMCREKYAVLRWVAYLMIVLGAFITIFLVLEKLGLVHLAPTIAQYKV